MSMDRDRLIALIDAYGGDLRRWPEDEREAARALLALDAEARDRLEEAAELDAVLDASPRPAASADLRDRVIASAASAGLKPRERFHIGRLLWWSGAGWAAAACAGVVFGIGLTTHVTADAQADAVLYQAALAGVDDVEVLG